MDENKEKYTIGEIAELFGVPKSTLRFWEDEQLIRLDRNHTNDYREYTVKDIIELCDIIFYRNLNVSIKQLRKIHEMDLADLKNVLNDTQQSIEASIAQLNGARERILFRKDEIARVEELKAQPYKPSEPDMQCVIAGTLSDSISYDPSFLALVCPGGDHPKIRYGIAEKDKSLDGEVIWAKENTRCKYAQCLLKVSATEPERNDLAEHQARLKKRGHACGVTVARYLATATEDTVRYDYYHTWIELLPL